MRQVQEVARWMPTGRARRMRWIEQVDLPMAEKFLIRVIEGHARDGGACRLKAETVATEMGCSTRTVFRTIKSCVELGVLRFAGNRYKGEASDYEIVWPGVGRLLSENPKTSSVIEPCEDACINAGDTVNDGNVASVEQQVTQEAVPTSHDILSTTDTIASGASTHAGSWSLMTEVKQTLRPCAEVEALSNVLGMVCPERPAGGWGRPLTIQDFETSESVSRLWETAVKFRYLTGGRSTQVEFFATAKSMSRRYRLPESDPNHVRDPGAYFTAAVSKRRWSEEPADIKAAIEAVERIRAGRR